LGQDLNSHTELNRTNDELEDIGIELEAKLKTLFDCSPAKLLPRSLEESPSSPQLRVPQSLNQSITVSGILLAKLHDEALKYSPLFPHDVEVNELLGLGLHWISQVSLVC
jgi:hypothetical protein